MRLLRVRSTFDYIILNGLCVSKKKNDLKNVHLDIEAFS